jgi:hypothetical protein
MQGCKGVFAGSLVLTSMKEMKDMEREFLVRTLFC